MEIRELQDILDYFMLHTGDLPRLPEMSDADMIITLLRRLIKERKEDLRIILEATKL